MVINTNKELKDYKFNELVSLKKYFSKLNNIITWKMGKCFLTKWKLIDDNFKLENMNNTGYDIVATDKNGEKYYFAEIKSTHLCRKNVSACEDCEIENLEARQKEAIEKDIKGLIKYKKKNSKETKKFNNAFKFLVLLNQTKGKSKDRFQKQFENEIYKIANKFNSKAKFIILYLNKGRCNKSKSNKEFDITKNCEIREKNKKVIYILYITAGRMQNEEI